jgi:hypothetical protein
MAACRILAFAGWRRCGQQSWGKRRGLQIGRFQPAPGRWREDKQAFGLMQFCSHRPDSPAFLAGSRGMLEPQQVVQRTVQVKLHSLAVHGNFQYSLSMNMCARRLSRYWYSKPERHACRKHGLPQNIQETRKTR